MVDTIIRDPSNAYAQKVTSDGRGKVTCISTSVCHSTNHEYKEFYTAYFSQSPTANNDCVFFIKNQSSDYDLVIPKLKMNVDGAVEVYAKIGDVGTPNAGTTITPINWNSSGTNACDAIIEYGADLDNAGASLSGGSEFYRWIFSAANYDGANTTEFELRAQAVITQNKGFSLWVSDSARTLRCHVLFNFHRSDSH